MVRLKEKSSTREFDEIDAVDHSISKYSVDEKCQAIFGIDPSILFVGIGTKDGQILGAKYKKDTKPFLDDIKTEFSISYQILSSLENTRAKDKLGNLMYSVTAYENQKRATFSLDNGILLISFGKSGDENKIIHSIIYDVRLG